MRGQLTAEIKAKAVEMLNRANDRPNMKRTASIKVRNFTQDELRLMAYVQYVMVNDQKLDPRKINQKERKILARWRERGWIEGGASGLAMTKEFWDAMSEILWLGYVAYRDYEGDKP